MHDYYKFHRWTLGGRTQDFSSVAVPEKDAGSAVPGILKDAHRIWRSHLGLASGAIIRDDVHEVHRLAVRRTFPELGRHRAVLAAAAAHRRPSRLRRRRGRQVHGQRAGVSREHTDLRQLHRQTTLDRNVG